MRLPTPFQTRTVTALPALRIQSNERLRNGNVKRDYVCGSDFLHETL
jgi:hypothetical protein